jgi:GT2 family glycosyltransferase/SAM-dependent methyltransferase/glycosyltransferase involved in cell wall biosynthesis
MRHHDCVSGPLGGTLVTAQRRAGAPRLIDWTGERCVPWTPDIQVVYEHLHRYLWASRIVRGRKVLDLGSGEGFGAAILADTAPDVVGIDIDGRTVEHSQLNYSRPGLSFAVGDATDLSRFADDTFGAVVAFEIIEHIAEQQKVVDEIARVLTADGVLVVSTPDRRPYTEVSGQENPFHVRELSLDEFSELLSGRFAHRAVWGQRTITGSHIGALEASESDGREAGDGDRPQPAIDFFVERSGDDWRLAPGNAPMYLLAVASPVPLSGTVPLSTLADPGIELLRATERRAAEASNELLRRFTEIDSEREREAGSSEGSDGEQSPQQLAAQRAELESARALNRDLDVHVHHLEELTSELRRRVSAKEQEAESLSVALAAAHEQNRRLEGSVTIQLFRKVSGKVYSVIGRDSLVARALRASLRLVGRLMAGRSAAQAGGDATARRRRGESSPPIVQFPEFDQPIASLIIPLHARADLTLACLQSISAFSAPVPYEVILIDDAADSETRELLFTIAGAQTLRNRRNAGYLRSVNRAAQAARGRWLVLCNNDIEVRPGWLEALVRCGDSAADIGVVTPKYLQPDGALSEAGAIIWRDGTGWNYGRGDDPQRPRYQFRRDTDYGSAAALLVRVDFWRDRGGFDERFLPMYYEDADLCLDAHERGLRVVYEPEAVVVHHEGSTAGTDVTSGHKRHQEQNRPKFVSKWHHRLDAKHARPNPKSVRRAADNNHGPHALIIDARVPMPDRDSGSLRMLHMIETLRERGCRVTFVPDNFAAVQPYTIELQRRGVQVLDNAHEFPADLASIGPELRLAILSRPHQASRWLDMVRERAPNALVAYDTVDLHWLREARRAATGGDHGAVELGPKALALRELELAMIRATDVTLVVSDAERAQVQADVPAANVAVVPNAHAVEVSVPPPETREGVLYVGGFEHPPNTDAVIRLVRDVMPHVWRGRPDIPTTVVGPAAPPEIEALASDRVDIAGWVPDLLPVLGSARVLLAPLTYGAGLKGKITQAMAAGLPVVTTPIGAEGLEATHGEQLLIAEDDRALAARAVEVLTDSELWLRLSQGGQQLVRERCSLEVMGDRLEELLSEPADAGRAHGRAQLHL